MVSTWVFVGFLIKRGYLGRFLHTYSRREYLEVEGLQGEVLGFPYQPYMYIDLGQEDATTGLCEHELNGMNTREI